jgi:hypothetical protein
MSFCAVERYRGSQLGEKDPVAKLQPHQGS